MPMPKTMESMGAVPQDQIMRKTSAKTLSDSDIEAFRQNPRIKQAIEIFAGHPVDISDPQKFPDELLVEVAGMVAKLGPQGAADMARKMLPQQVQEKIRDSLSGSSFPPQVGTTSAQVGTTSMPSQPSQGDVAAIRG